MKTIPSRILVWTVGMLLCAACSVKEDRESCPCRLLLDFSGVDTSVVMSADLSVTAPGGLVFEGEVDSGRFDVEYEIAVPREMLWVNAYAGDGDCYVQGEGVVIPYGEPAPEVYLYASQVDARCEWLRRRVEMRKEFCIVTIQVNEEGGFPFCLVVDGCVDGYGLDGSPRTGTFRTEASGDVDGGFRVTVPRQVDASLALSVENEKGESKVFAIGEYIVASGYDWTKPDLDDVTLWLDYSRTQVTIRIAGWDKEYTYDVVI